MSGCCEVGVGIPLCPRLYLIPNGTPSLRFWPPPRMSLPLGAVWPRGQGEKAVVALGEATGPAMGSEDATRVLGPRQRTNYQTSKSGQRYMKWPAVCSRNVSTWILRGSLKVYSHYDPGPSLASLYVAGIASRASITNVGTSCSVTSWRGWRNRSTTSLTTRPVTS